MSRLMYYAMYGLINKGADQTTDAQAGWSAPLLCIHYSRVLAARPNLNIL